MHNETFHYVKPLPPGSHSTWASFAAGWRGVAGSLEVGIVIGTGTPYTKVVGASKFLVQKNNAQKNSGTKVAGRKHFSGQKSC